MLQGRRFTNIKQLIDRLQTSFGVSRDSCVWYAELKRLSLKRRESIAAYIERAQTLYNNIIEAERYEKQSLTDFDITRINGRFIDEFYCGLPNNIQILVEKRDARTPLELYEMVESANKKLEEKYNSQPQAYVASSRIARYEPGAGTRAGPSYTQNVREILRNCRGNDRVDNRKDHSRDDSRERSDGNINTMPRDRPSGGASEPRNERNSKWGRYCKISSHKIEECRKREYNNSWNNRETRKTPRVRRTGLERVRATYVR
jgi:hypothetical protein